MLLALTIAGIARADEVHLTGTTMGRFNGDAFAPIDNLMGLGYENSTFDNDTVGGSLDLGGNPLPGANFNNMGTFTLLNANNTYNGNTFDLMVTFTAPTGINGTNVGTFTDQISGTVLNGNGGVFIDFDNTPQLFTYNNGAVAGWFTMFVNDVSLSPGQVVSLTAHVTGSQQVVPEPAGWAGLGFGLIGLARFSKRKK